MGTGLFNDGNAAYRKLLEKKIHLVTWNVPIWKDFMGFIGGKKSMFDAASNFGSSKKLQATGKPIEVYQDFKKEGGIEMEIPIFYPLTGKGTSGNLMLSGKGESAKFAYMKVKINQQRHAYNELDNKMSRQHMNQSFVQQLLKNSTNYLANWFQRWVAYQPYLALLEGASENLTKTAAQGGMGFTKASHMNIYVAGSGKVAYSATAATYEGNIVSALGGLASSDAGDVFSTTIISNMVYAASTTHRIEPIDYMGSKLYLIIITPSQALQLRKDAAWVNAQKDAFDRGTGNKLFTGEIEGVYDGAIIIVDKTIPAAYVTGDSDFVAAAATLGTTGGVQYGLADADGTKKFMSTTVDAGANKPAILLGASALAMGVAQDIMFAEELSDFGQKKEVGADMIVGVQRADIIDVDGFFGTAGARHENCSSLICYTYSPNTASW